MPLQRALHFVCAKSKHKNDFTSGFIGHLFNADMYTKSGLFSMKYHISKKCIFLTQAGRNKSVKMLAIS